MKILDKCPSITVPNFRMFGQHFTKKNQNYGCIVEWCECISAISEKQPILKTPQHRQCCLDWVQILYSGRYELVLPVKFCFVKICVVLSDILSSQKCIKWGWCIIKGWMTVPYARTWSSHSARIIIVPCAFLAEFSLPTTGSRHSTYIIRNPSSDSPLHHLLINDTNRVPLLSSPHIASCRPLLQ